MRHRDLGDTVSTVRCCTTTPFQRPAQTASRQLRPRLGSLGGVLAPHMRTLAAPVATDGDHQRRGSPPERLVGKASDHGVTHSALAAAPTAPLVRLEDPAGQYSPVWIEALPYDFEAEVVDPGERGQVRAGEGSVRQVEVFQVAGVGTAILGRPRRLPGHWVLAHRYTINYEEPVKAGAGRMSPCRGAAGPAFLVCCGAPRTRPPRGRAGHVTPRRGANCLPRFEAPPAGRARPRV